MIAEGDLFEGVFDAEVELGDVNGDGRPDLVRGEEKIDDTTVVRAQLGKPDEPGGPSGSDGFTVGSTGWHGEVGPIIAVGDVNGDGFDDVAVGQIRAKAKAKNVQLWYGSEAGIAFDREPDVITMESVGLPGPTGQGDTSFGNDLAIADTNGDGYAELAIGMPKGTVGTSKNAGVVVTVPGSSVGPDTSRSRIIHQDTPAIPGQAEQSDAFGSRVEYRDLAGGPNAELMVTAPNEDQQAGKIYVIDHEDAWQFRPEDAGINPDLAEFGMSHESD